MNNFFSELSRRNVFRVAAAYAIVGWILLQVASIVAPAMGLPGTAVTFVLFVVLMGFPLAIILTWSFDTTPDGATSLAPVAGGVNKIDVGLISASLLLVAAAFFAPARIQAPAPVLVDASVEDNTLTEAEVPSFTLAVLPFENFSDDKQLGWIADGISEDVLTQLSYIPRLGLAARNSSFQFKGENLDIRAIGEQLNVRYILEGSIRKQGDALRITAQLIETETGNHIWADQFNPSLTEISSLHDIVIGEMVTSVASILTKTEYDRLSSVSIEELAGIDLIHMAGVAILSGNAEVTQQYADLAVAKVPELSAAHSYRAIALMMSTATAPTNSDDIEIEIFREIDLALAATNLNVQSYVAIATVLINFGEGEKAKAYSELAVEFGPYYPTSYATLSGSEMALGNYQAALEAANTCAEHAHRKDPIFPVCIRVLVGAQNALELYDDALASFLRFPFLKNDALSQMERVIALVGKGDVGAAQSVAADLRSDSAWSRSLAKIQLVDERRFSDAGYVKLRIDAFRQAGWK